MNSLYYSLILSAALKKFLKALRPAVYTPIHCQDKRSAYLRRIRRLNRY
jgi:hypothetical protein